MGNEFGEGHRGGGAPPESWAAPFRKALSLRGRPEARVKWYFIWARRFAASLSGMSLHLATREDAEGFLTTLASSPGIDAWQVEQATDALTILPGSAFGQETDGGEPAATYGRSYQGGRSIRAGSDPLDDHRDPLAHPDTHGA